MSNYTVKVFSADWCGPCKTLKPIIKDLHENNSENFNLEYINVDAEVHLATANKVRGVPTIILFEDDKDVARKVGALSKSQLKDFLEENNVNVRMEV